MFCLLAFFKIDVLNFVSVDYEYEGLELGIIER